MTSRLLLTSFALLIMSAGGALAQSKLELQPNDTVPIILAGQIGQAIELRLKSGEKLAGKLEKQNEKLVHLSSLTGAEFYDAVVSVEEIAAVVVRTKAK